jgi:hypothetical protein
MRALQAADPRGAAPTQRLREENLQQQQLLQQMMSRVDKLELLIEDLEEEKQKKAAQPDKSLLGGFFSARGP